MLLPLLTSFLFAATNPASLEKSPAQICVQQLGSLPGKISVEDLAKICAPAQHLADCVSEKGEPIFHIDHATERRGAKKILAFSLIHGDEKPAGVAARAWLERMLTLKTRSHWRIVPVLNPDGVVAGTRTNSRGVDLNRNFPTADWEKDALKFWERYTKKDKRRYPGPSPASEKETRCAIHHLEDYHPDFVISVHTPLAVLDFDGPKDVRFPKHSKLPWKTLGNFPGSLGRYMWKDRAKPVTTVELAGNEVLAKLDQYEELQDLLGTVATQVDKSRATSSTPKPEH